MAIIKNPIPNMTIKELKEVYKNRKSNNLEKCGKKRFLRKYILSKTTLLWYILILSIVYCRLLWYIEYNKRQYGGINMPSKSSNNSNNGKSNSSVRVDGSAKSNSGRTEIKHSAVSNPVPGNGGKKNK